MIPRSVRHRISRRRLSRYVWGSEPIVSPYLDRLRDAAVEPCWRTTPEGREYQQRLAAVLGTIGL